MTKKSNESVKIKDYANPFWRRVLYILVRHIGKWTLKIIMFPTVSYFIATKKQVRTKSLRFWGQLYPDRAKWRLLYHIYKNYATFGVTLVDRITECEVQNDNVDRQVLDLLSDENRGVILLCSHVGAYNFYRFNFGEQPIHIMIELGNEERDEKQYIMLDRSNHGTVRFIRPSDPNSIFEASEVLNQKGILAIMGDRPPDPNSRHVKSANILGMDMKIPLGAWQLAYIREALILCIFIIKKEDGYHLLSKDPIDLNKDPSKTKKQAIDDGVCQYIRYLEEMVREYPHQWFNFTL